MNFSLYQVEISNCFIHSNRMFTNWLLNFHLSEANLTTGHYFMRYFSNGNLVYYNCYITSGYHWRIDFLFLVDSITHVERRSHCK